MRNGVPCKLLLILTLLAFGWSVADLRAQDTSQQAPSGSSQNPNKQDVPADAGGPGGDVGPYAIPKKKDETPPPAPETARGWAMPQHSPPPAEDLVRLRERVSRVRWLAACLAHDEAGRRLDELADELNGRADELEAANRRGPPPYNRGAWPR